MDELFIAMSRKILFMGLIFGGWRMVDYFYFKAFDTDVELKGNPNAIAILLGLFTLAMALA